MRALILGLVFVLSSCLPGATSGSHANPGRATAKRVALQPADVPVLQKCPQSDRWAGLLLTGQPEMLPTGFATWSELQAAGATEGWLSMYADNVAECPLLFGSAPPRGRIVYSAVIGFRNASSAEASFAADSMAFPVAANFFDRYTAAGGKLIKGSETGIGEHSAVATIAERGVAIFVAFWQNKNFEAVLWGDNVSPSEAGSAVNDMNARIR